MFRMFVSVEDVNPILGGCRPFLRLMITVSGPCDQVRKMYAEHPWPV